MKADRLDLAIIAAALGVLIIAGIVTFGYYSSLSSTSEHKVVFGNLELTSTSVHLDGLERGGLSLSLDAVIFNPNGIGATLTGANYSVYANGALLGSGGLARTYVLSPRSSLELSFPIRVGWASALSGVGGYLGALGHVTWVVNGTALVKLGGIAVTAPFDFSFG